MEEPAGRREQILHAALEEFAAHGFSGATIKGIARAARLQSQALIYWYFPTKEALFQAVIEMQIPFLRDVGNLAMLGDRPPQEVLPDLARSYLGMAERPMTQRLLRLLIPEVLRRQEIAGMVGSLIATRILAALNLYLQQQVELGRLRPHDTRASARAFIGMLIPQVAGIIALPSLQADGLTSQEHLDTAVEIFLRGLRVDL